MKVRYVVPAIVGVWASTAMAVTQVTDSSGFVSYPTDTEEVRVYVLNNNPVLDKDGNPNPPCVVDVVVTNGVDNTTQIVEDAAILPQRAMFQDFTLAAPVGGDPGIFGAQVIYDQSKLCSPKTLTSTADTTSDARAGNRYELQVRGSNRVR